MKEAMAVITDAQISVEERLTAFDNLEMLCEGLDNAVCASALPCPFHALISYIYIYTPLRSGPNQWVWVVSKLTEVEQPRELEPLGAVSVSVRVTRSRITFHVCVGLWDCSPGEPEAEPLLACFSIRFCSHGRSIE